MMASTDSISSSNPELENYDFIFKIVVLGDSGVGKTNLVYRFTKNEFKTDSKATIGVEFSTKTVKMKNDGKMVKAQIWDTAGQERYRSIASSYYRGAVGALVVYDVTDRDSFLNLHTWKNELAEHAGKDALIVLVGNKIDLTEKRAVSAKEGRSFARKNGLAFIETSALESTGVSLAFERVLQQIYDNKLASRSVGVMNVGAATSSSTALAAAASNDLGASAPSSSNKNNTTRTIHAADKKILDTSTKSTGSMTLATRRSALGIPLPGIMDRGKVTSYPDLRKYDISKRPMLVPVTKTKGKYGRFVKSCIVVLICASIITFLTVLQFHSFGDEEEVRYVTSSVPLPTETAVGEGDLKGFLDFVHCGSFFDKNTIQANNGFEVLLLHDAQSHKESWRPVQDRLCSMGGPKASVTAIDLAVTSDVMGLKKSHRALINAKVLSDNPVTIVTPTISGNMVVQMIDDAKLVPAKEVALRTHLKNWVVIGTPTVMPLPKDELDILTDLGIDTLAVYGSNNMPGKAVHDKLVGDLENAKGVVISDADKAPQFEKPEEFAKELLKFLNA